MRKHLAFVIAAAMAAGGLGWLGHAAFADDPVPNEKLPQGIQKSQKDDSNDIRKDLGSATDSLLMKGDINKFISWFSDSDRARLEGYFRQNRDKLNELNGRIAQIQADWQTRYNQKFDLNGEVVFGPQYRNLEIVQGQVNNPAMLSNWPVPNGGEHPNPKGQNPDIKQNSEVAIVTFPMEHGLGDLNVSLVKESSWRIDIPKDVDSQRLYTVLLNNLTNFGDSKDKWPSDVNDAYRLVSRYVLMSCYNIPAPKGMGEMKEGMTH